MKILGITGGIGAGKSTVLACIEERFHACVIQADRVAYDLQQPGGACYERITKEFGPGILSGDKTIDRAALARVVFADSARLQTLNQIVHPAVKQWILKETARRRESGTRLTVIEAALLLEDHYDLICDEIWYIRADEQVRVQRLMDSRGYTREKALQVMKNQLSDAQYRERCRRIIDNSGDFAQTQRQIDEAMRSFGVELYEN